MDSADNQFLASLFKDAESKVQALKVLDFNWNY